MGVYVVTRFNVLIGCQFVVMLLIGSVQDALFRAVVLATPEQKRRLGLRQIRPHPARPHR